MSNDDQLTTDTIVDEPESQTLPVPGEQTVLFPLSESVPPPLSPSVSGQDPHNGRFLPGNRIGRGNPVARQASRLRKALYAAVTPADLQEVVQSLVAQAKAGDVAASKIVLSTLLGPPQSLDVLAVVAKLENVVFRGVKAS